MKGLPSNFGKYLKRIIVNTGQTQQLFDIVLLEQQGYNQIEQEWNNMYTVYVETEGSVLYTFVFYVEYLWHIGNNLGNWMIMFLCYKNKS